MKAGESISRIRGGCGLAVVTLVTLVACEPEITVPLDEQFDGQLTVDATSSSAWTYVSLADGGRVVTPADPSTSTDWHMAFRRYGVKLNGGVAGPGEVAGHNLGSHAGATDDQVRAFTRSDADAAWEEVTSDDASHAIFQFDQLIEDTGGSWFRFDPVANSLVANPAATWRLDLTGTGFALFRVSSLTLTPAPDYTPVRATIQVRVQESGGVLGPITGVTVELTENDGYIDVASASVVDPEGCNWDLRMTREFGIEVNDACGSGTFPLGASEDFTTIQDASEAPVWAGFLAVLSGAFPTSVEDAEGIFWYNLDGSNRLFPTYNVFLVRTGLDVYKVQVLDYYSATGASGFPTVRFARLP